MKRLILFSGIVCAIIGCAAKSDTDTATAPTGSDAPAAAAVPAFASIESTMKASCVGCHGATNPKEGLNLTTYADLMKGGEHGAVVVPGDPANSRLVQFLRGTKTPRMPLKADPLPEETIKAVEAWIQAGAKA